MGELVAVTGQGSDGDRERRREAVVAARHRPLPIDT